MTTIFGQAKWMDISYCKTTMMTLNLAELWVSIYNKVYLQWGYSQHGDTFKDFVGWKIMIYFISIFIEFFFQKVAKREETKRLIQC